MSVHEYEPVIEAAHETSIEKQTIAHKMGIEFNSGDQLSMHVAQKQVDAKNAVFKELGRGRLIEGENVVDAVEALMYSYGRDRSTAQTMAGRLATVVSGEELDKNPVAVLTARADWRRDVVGVVGSRFHGLRESVHVSTGYLSKKAQSFRKEAELWVPFTDTSFWKHDNDKDDSWHIRLNDDTSTRVDLKDVLIFDDPDEAIAHREAEGFVPYILVGNEAVSHFLTNQAQVESASQRAQSAFAARNLIEAAVQGLYKPDTRSIDLTGAIESTVRAFSDSKDPRLPAQAHPEIIGQVPQSELLELAKLAIGNMSTGDAAKSGRLTYIRLNRKLDAELERAAEDAIAGLLGHAGVVYDNLPPQDKGLAASLVPVLKDRYVSSLDAHLEHNHHFEYALRPFGVTRQRRRAAKVMNANKQ